MNYYITKIETSSNPDFSSAEKSVYSIVESMNALGRKSKHGDTFISIDGIANYLGLCHKSVKRIMKIFKDKGIMIRDTHPDSNGKRRIRILTTLSGGTPDFSGDAYVYDDTPQIGDELSMSGGRVVHIGGTSCQKMGDKLSMSEGTSCP